MALTAKKWCYNRIGTLANKMRKLKYYLSTVLRNERDGHKASIKINFQDSIYKYETYLLLSRLYNNYDERISAEMG